MKTALHTLFASALVMICLSATTFTVSASERDRNIVVLETAIPCIQKVIVKGNVNVSLVQAEKESVKVYEAYNPDRTSIKMLGTSLVISSTEDEPVHVTVYVKNPFRIEASNTSFVRTSGKFDLPFLQIILKDQARANVNASTKGLYTVINDHAKLKLSGASAEHVLIRSKFSKLQMDKFVCLKTTSPDSEALLARDTIKHPVITRLLSEGR